MTRARRIIGLFQELPGDIFQKEFRYGGFIGVYKYFGLACKVWIFLGEKGKCVLACSLAMWDGDTPDDDPRIGVHDEAYSDALDEYADALEGQVKVLGEAIGDSIYDHMNVFEVTDDNTTTEGQS
jgi:hypothetical protein